MADQFDKQNSKENERKTERRHREFLGVIDKLQEGITGLDKSFSQLGEDAGMDPDAKKVFEQIDKKTLKSIHLDEKFARTFSASTLKQLDVLGSMKSFEKKSEKHLLSINRSTGQNLGHFRKIGEQFRNIFGILPGRGARIRTAQAENAQVDQRNALRSIRDINKRSLLTLLKLHDMNAKSGMSLLEEKKEAKQAREKSEKNLLDALGLLGPSADAEKKPVTPFLGILAAGAGLAFLGKMLKGTKFESTFKSIIDFTRFFGIIGNGMILMNKKLRGIMKGKFTRGMGRFTTSLRMLINGFLKIFVGQGASLAAIGGWMRGTKVSKGLMSIVRFFQGIKQAVQVMASGPEAVKGLGGGKLAQTVSKFMVRIGKIFGGISKFLPSLGPILKMGKVILKAVGKFFLPITILFAVYDAITGFMKGMEGGGSIFDGVQGALSGIVEGLLSPFAMILDWIGEYIGIGPIGTELLEPIMAITNGIFQAIIAPFKTILEFAKSMFAGDFKEAFTGLFSNIFDWFMAIPKALMNAIGGIFGYGDMGDDVVGGMKSVFMSIFSPIADAMAGAVSWVLDLFKTEEQKAMAAQLRAMEKDNTFQAKKFNRMMQYFEESQGKEFLGERFAAKALSEEQIQKKSGEGLEESRRKAFDRLKEQGSGMVKGKSFEDWMADKAERSGFGNTAAMLVSEKTQHENLLLKRENFISKHGMDPETASAEMEKRYTQLREQFDIDFEKGKYGNLEGVSDEEWGKTYERSFQRFADEGMAALDVGGQTRQEIVDEVKVIVAEGQKTDWRRGAGSFEETQIFTELVQSGDTDELVAAIETIREDGLATAENIVTSALDAMPDLVESAVGTFVEASSAVKENLISAINAFREARQLGALTKVVTPPGGGGNQVVSVPVANTNLTASGASRDAATGQSDRG